MFTSRGLSGYIELVKTTGKFLTESCQKLQSIFVRAMDFTEAECQRLLPSLDAFKVIEERIGKRGCGVVDKAVIIATGQTVAMKRMIVAEREFYESLVREFKLMCSVSHPALDYAVGLYHPDDWTQTVLVTPFYENGSLRNLLQAGSEQLKNTGKAVIVLGIVAGMAALQEAGIAHRDLKPDNILIDDKLRPIITDFGVSRRYTPETPMSTEIGTCVYMAPEVMEGDAGYDNSVDVYSFGMLLYELFTGATPFDQRLPLISLLEQKKLYNQLDIPRKVPKLFANIIRKCNRPPGERPTFEQIYIDLLVGYHSLSVNLAEIDAYKNVLREQMLYCCKFSIPKQLVKISPPETMGDHTSDSILLDELRSVLEREGDRHVVLIMVIGNFETGKSTYLRTLTGNAAFYPGKGTFSQTQGVLLDGPYRVSELIDRIPDDDYYGELREQCSQINIPSDPSIYFLDCQGTGDEAYEQYQKHVLEIAYAIFASVSTICINVCKCADQMTVMKSNIMTMRRGQLMGGWNHNLSQLLFLVRDYDASIDVRISEYSPDDYEEVLRDFTSEWLSEHGDATDHYIRENVHLAPLGNIRTNSQNYATTVWESLHKILKLIGGASCVPASKVMDVILYLSSQMFDPRFSELIKEVDALPALDTSMSTALRHYCGCCMFLSRFVASTIDDSEAAKQASEVLEKIEMIFNTLVQIVLPYLLGTDDVPGKDFLQYCVQIGKDTESYMKSNKNWWKKISTELRIGRRIGWKCSATVFVISGGLGLAVGAISLWSFFGIERNRIESIRKDSITILFPQIWKRNMIANRATIMETSKIVKPLSKRLLIAAYEQQNRSSRLLVQSLIGVELPEELETGKSYYFKSLKVCELLKRPSRDTKDVKVLPSMPKSIDFIYLGHVSDEELKRLSQVLGDSTIWVTSQLVQGEDPIQLQVPPDPQARFQAFMLSDSFFGDSAVTRETFVAEANRITAKYRESNSTGGHSFYLPISASNYDFESSGPRTDMSIRYCCRYILGEQKLHQTTED